MTLVTNCHNNTLTPEENQENRPNVKMFELLHNIKICNYNQVNKIHSIKIMNFFNIN